MACCRFQTELAEVLSRVGAAEKLAGERSARAEALEEDLVRRRADAEVQHHVILGLQQVKPAQKFCCMGSQNSHKWPIPAEQEQERWRREIVPQ